MAIKEGLLIRIINLLNLLGTVNPLTVYYQVTASCAHE